MNAPILIADFIDNWALSPFAGLTEPPWVVTANAEHHVAAALDGLASDFKREGKIAVHSTAIIEPGAVLKGPLVVGPRCFVAAGAYLRGGVFMDEDCIAGPGAELKTTLMFRGSKLAHFNFVGDSILGAGVNLEAGSIVANYRNELEAKAIVIGWRGQTLQTGVDKFGALIGDGAKIGANAVVAPGAILDRNVRIPRLALIDQRPSCP